MNLTIFETTWHRGEYFGHFRLKENPYIQNAIVAIFTDEEDDNPSFYYLEAKHKEKALAFAKSLNGETLDTFFDFLAENGPRSHEEDNDKEEGLPL